MALSIKDPESDRLARELAQATGETITEAIRTAIRERLQRVKAGTEGSTLADALNEIADHCAALPVLDDRPADEILDYDEQGLPR